MDLFILKKLAGNLIMPLPISLIILCLAIFYFLRDRKTKGVILSILGLGILIIFSTPWLPNILLADIEQKYKQFDLSQPVDTIVILGCGHSNDGSLPITSQLHSCSLKRTIEAIRIFQTNPKSQILISGYGGSEPFSNAEMNKKLALALAIPLHKITTFPMAKDTQEEAQVMAPKLMGKNIALVTSASHMPRAMSLFESQGIIPIAAPTDHLIKDESRKSWWSKVPGSYHMTKSERLWYEVMGQSWIKLKTWLSNPSS